MKSLIGPTLTIVLLSMLLVPAGDLSAEEYYYGVRINGVTCGYAVYELSGKEIEGKEAIVLEEYFFAIVSALGSRFDTELWLTYHIDPVTGGFFYHHSKIDQGGTVLESNISIRDGSAFFNSSISEDLAPLELPDDAVLENTLMFPHLKTAFVDNGLDKKTFNIYEVREHDLQETLYTLTGRETLVLAGKEYDALILEELNRVTGLKLRWWIDTETGMMLKTTVPGNREIFLSDESIKKKIEMVDLNETITVKTNESIGDVPAISYMKVRAILEPTGVWVTEEGLNVAGQRFEGTVSENRIEGIFEIEHVRYDGKGAPSFPPDFKDDEEVAGYLEPSTFAESDDPVLVRKAEELTMGSKDSWEAAVRLSSWVAENIRYAIPGGMTARKTFDCGEGECGAHSLLLAAFCRGVGIPARMVWGCMYIPNFGGAFGQHGWTEIYMGDAGWIPVDATVLETDFADSGHIRIAEYSSPSTALNGKEFEILEYRLSNGKDSGEMARDAEKYAGYVGKYTGPGGRVFEVLVENASLSVDIPGNVKLALNDPDENGKWYARISANLFITFEKDAEGMVEQLVVHELLRLQRQPGGNGVPEGTPGEYREYMGKYLLAAMQAEFTVFCDETVLAVDDPLNKVVVHFVPAEGTERFIDEYDRNYISFIRDKEGGVTALEIESRSKFYR